MSEKEQLKALDVELKKVAALDGEMSIVVVPLKYRDKAIAGKRDMDTLVEFREYIIIGMFGSTVDDASSVFLSVPKGVAAFPMDGKDIRTLFFLALDRLRMMDSSSWVRRLWDSVQETPYHDKGQSPEDRFIVASFYQFYFFISTHTGEMGKVFSDIPPSEQQWIRDLLPCGVTDRILPLEAADQYETQEVDELFYAWAYQQRRADKLEKGRKTLRKFRNIEHLFTLPAISSQIIDMAEDPLVGASRMAGVIERDPVLTSRLLKVVNSAFYGFHRQVDSVEHAVVILGNEEVINLAFAIAIYRVMGGLPQRDAAFLWEHSLMVAFLAQWLGSIMGYPAKKSMFYTLGLLHDLGKIILFESGEAKGGVDAVSGLENLAAEEQDVGFSHAEMGAYVAERWNLPAAIVDGIMNHHIPCKAEDMDVATVVHLADIIAHMGCIEMSEVSCAVMRFMNEKKDRIPSAEKVKKAYAETASKVKCLMEQ
ncbi:MAG: HDOD domain-containing protein [Thermodesulfobacteriota bacterium]|nr:HDOD domain-containing protein [Thermodesulfobacteriota bacterium]